MTEQPQATLARDEGHLVSEAKAGNYSAFEELVNRYEKKIYRLGMNITGNREDAEDVLQDAFLKAFEHLPDFREDSRFYTWIVRIAVNEALMKLRKRRTSREVPMDDSEDDNGEVVVREFADWKPNPEQQFAQAELERILQEGGEFAAAGFSHGLLPARRGRIIDGRNRRGAGFAEGAVKARLFRARLRLREELSKKFKRG